MILASTTVKFFEDNWLSVLIAAIMALFGGGGIAALIKTRSEAPKILVDAAQGAVVVQSGVIESLRDDLKAARAEITELRTHMTELNTLRNKVRNLEDKNRVLEAENVQMSQEIKDLQDRLNSNGLP